MTERMENKKKELTTEKLNQEELEKVNGGFLRLHSFDNNSGSGEGDGGATGGW